jgi:16S rRNA (guanine527-N7)-methyltransferase
MMVEGEPDALLVLAERWGLTQGQRDGLEILMEVVRDLPHAPTTIRTREGILRDHLADSLVALGLEEVRRARRLADIGSGPGFPGLALAVALPGCGVTLIEASRRKCAFLQEAATRIGARNVSVVCRRVEEWREGREVQDLVTARALAPPAVVVEYAAPLLIHGGAVVAWRGRLEPREDAAAMRAAELLGLQAEPPLPVKPYPEAEHRHLQLFRKTRPTPPRFPRRPGMARKRPLGSDASTAAPRS